MIWQPCTKGKRSFGILVWPPWKCRHPACLFVECHSHGGRQHACTPRGGAARHKRIPAFAFSSGFNYFCLPSMPIRLLALDLDGTLFNSHGQLTTGNSQAIEAARERGVRVAVVTGR